MKLLLSINIKEINFKKIIGLLIFIELFALGSGQILIVYSGITLRMVNFAIMIILGLFSILKKKRICKNLIAILIFYTIILFIGITLGIINGGKNKIFIDIKPLMYFYSIIFIYFYLNTQKDIYFVLKIFKNVILLMSVVYVLYIILLKNNLFEFSDVYNVLSHKTDFKFRGTTGLLFYKSFIYLPLILFYFNLKKGLFSIQSLIILLAIYYTETRSFWIMAVLSYILSLFYILKKNQFKVRIIRFFLFFTIAIIIGLFIYNNFVGLSGDRSGGDNIRILTIMQVLDRLDMASLFIGHGFGIGVPIRPIHMEISYLEIFHKQGLLGLFFWAWILFDSFVTYFKCDKYNDIATIFVVFIILIYLQSLFNPYLNNPIGMSVVIISYVSLKKIYKRKKEKIII